MQNKMNHKLKTILITLSSLALVACNGGGGGGSSGGDTPAPSPSPSPTPVAVQALNITQNVVPSLNKVGSHQTWYMVVNNPNAFTVNVLSNLNVWTVNNFRFDPANPSMPMNPTQYAMKYDNGVSGVTIDCLTLFNQSSSNALGAGQSCAFKLEAQWKGNSSGQTAYNFKMAYKFQYNNSYYIESIGCTANPSNNTYCLNGTQNLKFNLMNLSSITTINGQTGNNTNYGENIINIDGSTYWDFNSVQTGVANVYSLNYNSLTNTTNKILTSTYNGDQFTSGNFGKAVFAAVSTQGQNFYVADYNQNGIMPLVQSTVTDLGWVYGLDGNIYGSSSYTVYPQMIYKLNQVNNSLSSVIAAPNQILRGVSPTGSLLVDSTDGSKVTSCYAANSYSQTTMNLNGLIKQDIDIPLTTPNGYFAKLQNSTDYYNLYNEQTTVDNIFLINIDTCSIVKNQYFSRFFRSLNSKFGTITAEYGNANLYIESANQFSSGLNGGN